MLPQAGKAAPLHGWSIMEGLTMKPQGWDRGLGTRDMGLLSPNRKYRPSAGEAQNTSPSPQPLLWNERQLYPVDGLEGQIDLRFMPSSCRTPRRAHEPEQKAQLLA